ncbi:MAG TPA: L-threonylcarbamoyladenylate synthase [Syntrophomonadaceae bacterium]|nr:L-threonylcarbamoyladenylate synthase [Syntrophomonadaceae bacterium]HQA06594.1 L-threonylcarbamoyladenylate synthase [Syntrophomonadaceae bacterium]HQE22333.1 L-threonylcarbamoyladenylate synthase [Syntrophomonadaceae bacterium]
MVKTIYWQVNPDQPEQDIIQKAARIIKAGELVAFPTETVYGLGADAFSSPAVEKIYQVKNRPPVNPLLVHIARFDQVSQLAAEVTASARLLMERFWPGPLSLILPAKPQVPGIVTAHRPGVGLRMPSHPVALALINAAGPLAAPSANLSGRPSPVNAQHVKDDLDGHIAAVLDAGATGLGIESTVVDMCGPAPRLIRIGGVSRSQLESILGQKLIMAAEEPSSIPHYRTSAQVLLAGSETMLQATAQKYLNQGKKVAVVHNNISPAHKIEGVSLFHLNLGSAGSDIYQVLREAEKQQIEVLIFAPLPEATDGVTAAVLDRICQAAQNDPYRTGRDAEKT